MKAELSVYVSRNKLMIYILWLISKNINIVCIFAFDICNYFPFSTSSLPLVRWKWLKQQLAWGNKDVTRFILNCGRVVNSQGQIRKRSSNYTCVSFVLMTWTWYCITHAKPQHVTWFQEGRDTVIVLLLCALFRFFTFLVSPPLHVETSKVTFQCGHFTIHHTCTT
jgi:hypothetical protein